MEKKSCFIIMPFSQAKTSKMEFDEKTLNYIYENVIKNAITEYKVNDQQIFIDISRYNSRVGSIISGIASSLNTADLVIADLTGLNPNVMYELGVRHTLKRGTIIISQEIASIPSDLRDYMCVEYKYSESTIEQNENYVLFKTELDKAINELFTTDKFDSPVLNYLQGKENYWREDEIKGLKENIIIVSYILEQYDDIKAILGQTELPKSREALKKIIPLINNMYGAVNELHISVDSALLYDYIQAAKSLLSDIIKQISYSDYFQQLGEILPSPGQEFELFSNSFFKMKFYNYFYINEDDLTEFSFSEIFNDDSDFYMFFLEELEQYVEKKAQELGISAEEIDFMLTH